MRDRVAVMLVIAFLAVGFSSSSVFAQSEFREQLESIKNQFFVTFSATYAVHMYGVLFAPELFDLKGRGCVEGTERNLILKKSTAVMPLISTPWLMRGGSFNNVNGDWGTAYFAGYAGAVLGQRLACYLLEAFPLKLPLIENTFYTIISPAMSAIFSVLWYNLRAIKS